MSVLAYFVYLDYSVYFVYFTQAYCVYLYFSLQSEEELNLVRNYLLGQTLKSADGPYALMELFLSVENQNLDLDFFNDFIHKIKSIQAEELRDLALKYLDCNSFSIVSAG
jgi:predicted Zn-dependent peptidase